jgi:hypothetical protein
MDRRPKNLDRNPKARSRPSQRAAGRGRAEATPARVIAVVFVTSGSGIQERYFGANAPSNGINGLGLLRAAVWRSKGAGLGRSAEPVMAQHFLLSAAARTFSLMAL